MFIDAILAAVTLAAESFAFRGIFQSLAPFCFPH